MISDTMNAEGTTLLFGTSISMGTSPLLITGMTRAGTSWLGKMLAASGSVVYINEPLNVRHPNGLLLNAGPRHRYEYITRENESEFLDSFRKLLQLGLPIWTTIWSRYSAPDRLRAIRYSGDFLAGRLRHRRPMLDDPFAVFSAEWFSTALNCQTVIIVRHPAAIVSSRKGLGWKIDFRDFLNQPLLMRDWLHPFRVEMETMLATPDDIIGQGSLLWRMIYYAVWETKRRFPWIHIVRHEDLSMNPVAEYARLYKQLGLHFSPRVQRTIECSTSGKVEAKAFSWSGFSRTSFQPMDSRSNVKRWQQRLTSDEIARILELTRDIACLYYSDQDWK